MILILPSEVFVKIYHQQVAELSISNHGIDLISGETNYHNQKNNAFLEFDITLGKNGSIFVNPNVDGNIAEPIRLVRNAFVYAISLATLSTNG